jgi:predicted dehydrogenase
VVGCGAIAQAYLQVLRDVPELELAAAADVDPGTRLRTADRFQVPVFASAEELADKTRLDGALVLTPPSTHEGIACQLLARGCHVLCEKPLAVEPSSAQRMIVSAEAAGRTLMMASKFRYVADVAEGRRRVEAGLIGEVILFENVFCSHVDMAHRWNSRRKISGGGVLIDNGCHSVDVARFLMGPIDRVQAQFGKQVQPLEVEDTARLLFIAKSGAMGSVDLSWSLEKNVTSYVRLYGSKGTLEIGWRSSRYRLGDREKWTAFGNGYDKLAAFRSQLRNFARTILGLEAPLITTEDALQSVLVVDAAYRSASADKWIQVTS